jgi:flagellar biosynthetic protein FliQ
MPEEMIMSLSADAFKTILLLSGPMLIAALTIGVTVSVFQAVTQINEATLSFVPKMLAVVGVMVLMGPWMLEILREYTAQVFSHVAEWRH